MCARTLIARASDVCQRLAAYEHTVPLLPVQIRLHARPFEIVERVLTLNADAYRQSRDVLALAALLGIDDSGGSVDAPDDNAIAGRGVVRSQVRVYVRDVTCVCVIRYVWRWHARRCVQTMCRQHSH
jgi:hypothetical protein